MKIELDIPDYSPEKGITLNWKPDFMISTKVSPKGTIGITANSDGLVSLAIHLLTLAQSNVPVGSHLHYDAGNELELNSRELIISKAGDV
jgi:hypothetical protein